MPSSLFVGLGNPGGRYEATRHNLGIRVLRAWLNTRSQNAARFTDWHNARGEAAEAGLTLAGQKIICLFPLTFMNNSGRAVRAAARRRGSFWRPLSPEQLLIIHDELELPLGQVKIKNGGSARGHKGVKSIHEALSTTAIPRLLLGIGPKPAASVSDFVLEKFTPAEVQVIERETMPAAFAALDQIVKK